MKLGAVAVKEYVLFRKDAEIWVRTPNGREASIEWLLLTVNEVFSLRSNLIAELGASNFYRQEVDVCRKALNNANGRLVQARRLLAEAAIALNAVSPELAARCVEQGPRNMHKRKSGLSCRTENALINYGNGKLPTKKEMRSVPFYELLRIRNCGRVTVEEIKRWAWDKTETVEP